MASEQGDRRVRFLERLRQESSRGPGSGLGRLVRMARSSAGLARGVLASSGRSTDAPLGEREVQSLEDLVARLGELKGLPMKFGQIVSTLDLELPEEARKLFSMLQTQSPATPFERVEAVVREDLGTLAPTLLANLEREPISIASIGQVHRAQLPDGTPVAVKVRHPEIEAAIRSDFRAARLGTGMAAALVPGMGATAREFVAETQARLLEECDYRLEAERQELFFSLYAAHPVLCIPEVHRDWCGPRVLTSRWEPGQGFDAFAAEATQSERDHAGRALFDFYIGTLYRNGLFHADPHPGNYVFRKDGRVVVFDFGCVRVFEPGVTQSFVALADAVRADDRARACAALRGLGADPSSNDVAYAQLRQLLRSFFHPLLVPGPRRIDGRVVVEMRQIMRDKLTLARLRLPGRLMFLCRIRFGLYAVLSRLGAVADWASLEQGFATEAGFVAGRV